MTITNRNLSAGKGRFRRAFSKIASTAVLAAGLALAAPSLTTGPSGSSIAFFGGEAKAGIPKRARNYSASVDPFALDRKLKKIARAVPSGSTKAKVEWIFKRLNRYASGGVKPLSMTGKPPRTAAQALKSGGDCTDLANIVIALFKEKKIPGGVMLVHFSSFPKNYDHLVPYALISGRRVIVDLQTNRLGRTAQATYKKLMDLTYNQAAGMYHREMGDYFKNKGNKTKALKAYKRSLQLNDKDTHVHQNIAVIYRELNDHINALKHIRKAVALDSRYKKFLPGALYNAGLQAGKKAFQEGRYADCAKHFQSALNSGLKIPPASRKVIQQNIRVCRSRAR